MSWRECSAMSLRLDLVTSVIAGQIGIAEISRRFGVSRKTAYKWLGRYRQGGAAGLADRSRRPQHTGRRTSPELEEAVVGLRQEHPCWGGRKLHRRLKDQGHPHPPAPSTITDICRRRGLLDPAESEKHRAWQRFVCAAPNDLWQMDFKGHFAMTSGGRCHPLTVLDDHSRFALGLRACADEQFETVQVELTGLFRRYGLPQRMLMDNGSPWGNSEADHGFTPLTVWLLRLDVGVSHSRPRHPQTQGKDERFHRTLNSELLRRNRLRDLTHCQDRFDPWRDVYNHERPHEALGLDTPAQHYRASNRHFPERLPELEYDPMDHIRRVTQSGKIWWNSHRYHLCKAFAGLDVGLRPTLVEGVYDVYLGQHPIGEFSFPRAHADQSAFNAVRRVWTESHLPEPVEN